MLQRSGARSGPKVRGLSVAQSLWRCLHRSASAMPSSGMQTPQNSGAILSVIDRRFGWLAFLSGGAYAAANGFASLRIASRGHKPELPYLPAAFACIHLPAGAGLLYGFVRGVFRARTK